MIWTFLLDKKTWDAAQRIRPALPQQPLPQYNSTYPPRRLMNAANWQGKLRPAQVFSPQIYSPANPAMVWPSPANIIMCFQAGDFLQAHSMVVKWGTMWRQNPRIYAQPLNVIENSLRTTSGALAANAALNQQVWSNLQQLGWSFVMISKNLHFLSRAMLPNHFDWPVPLDNAFGVQKLWEGFKQQLQIQHRAVPAQWKDPLTPFAGYCRYMTAVLVWTIRTVHSTVPSPQLPYLDPQGLNVTFGPGMHGSWSTMEWETTCFQQGTGLNWI